MDGKAVSPTEKNFDALAANMAAVNVSGALAI